MKDNKQLILPGVEKFIHGDELYHDSSQNTKKANVIIYYQENIRLHKEKQKKEIDEILNGYKIFKDT